ncbi:hypothetical protein ACE6H2_014412 [Prunus campanulata]
MKIYSVSTRCYYAFEALVSEEISYKIKVASGVHCPPNPSSQRKIYIHGYIFAKQTKAHFYFVGQNN